MPVQTFLVTVTCDVQPEILEEHIAEAICEAHNVFNIDVGHDVEMTNIQVTEVKPS